MTLSLKNPHSVLAALATRPQDVLEIVAPASASDAWGEVLKVAREKKVKIQARQPQPPHEFSPGSPGRGPRPPREEGGRLGGIYATVREREGISAEELFRGADQRAGGKGLWIALDNLQDPHNVGAIFRAASFFGVQGIILTQERSAPLSGTVYDVASGGLETVPFTLQINLQRAFEIAKESGLWILGTSEHARDSLSSIQRDRPWLLVLGNEEKGMRRLTEEACDVLCKIKSASASTAQVTSLNVSVAAGIFISRLAGEA